jgi:hypothetical protein
VPVPAQYDGTKDANLLVFQDGARAVNPEGSLRVPQVLENLIHKGDIPATLGLFITPGQRGENYPEDLGTRNPDNRAAGHRWHQQRRDPAGHPALDLASAMTDRRLQTTCLQTNQRGQVSGTGVRGP